MPNFFGNFDFLHILELLPAVIIGLTVHEAAHAAMASVLGDKTAKEQGRVSLNPLQHIDWFGLLFIIFAGFGWAKPVNFNEENLRHPDRDVPLIAIIGPVANALLAIISSVGFVLYYHAYGAIDTGFIAAIGMMLWYMVTINWGLFIFNLIPLPPLDGSHLVFRTIRHNPQLSLAFYRIGSFVLFGILIFQALTEITILPIGQAVQFLTTRMFGLLGLQ